MKMLSYNPVHINTYGLGSSRFARRYSGNRKNCYLSEARLSTEVELHHLPPIESSPLLLSIPPGTEMFHFPGCAPTCVGLVRNTRGFPIRTFPGNNGCLAPYRNLSQPYHVLHRFVKPRHPPYTLTFLQGMLYTAVQFDQSYNG